MTAVRCEELVDEPEYRTLTTARRADKAYEFSLIKAEAKLVYGWIFFSGISKAYILEFEHSLAHALISHAISQKAPS